MLRVVNLGPLAVPVPDVLILMGFWIALSLAERHAPRYKVDPERLYYLIVSGVLAGLIGARLTYAARTPAAFLENPLNLLAFTPQMLDPLGGWLFAALGAGVYAFRKKMPLWRSLDALTSLFSVLFVAFGLANLASGAGFGAPSDLPWSIDLWGERRHPTQVYETLAALLIAASVWPKTGTADSQNGPGMRFLIFVALTAASRLALESFRGDSTLVLGLFRQAQLIAWVVLALSLWQIGRRQTDPPAPTPAVEET